MRWPAQKSKRRGTGALALVLAVLCLVFLLQVTPHEHTNAQDEATCQFCQVAHVSAIPAVSGIVLNVRLLPLGEARAPEILTTRESFSRHSDPRAPPAEALQ
jgi:hypothetical protein